MISWTYVEPTGTYSGFNSEGVLFESVAYLYHAIHRRNDTPERAFQIRMGPLGPLYP